MSRGYRIYLNRQLEWLRLRVGVPIAGDHRRSKAVPLAHHGCYEARLLRVVPQRQADLADCGVDAVNDIDEDVLAPQALGDLFARDQLPAPLHQQDEQLHGEFFQAQQTLTPLQPITGLVECEIAKLEFLGRTSPIYALTRVA